jgi:hypothetical protein
MEASKGTAAGHPSRKLPIGLSGPLQYSSDKILTHKCSQGVVKGRADLESVVFHVGFRVQSGTVQSEP